MTSALVLLTLAFSIIGMVAAGLALLLHSVKGKLQFLLIVQLMVNLIIAMATLLSISKGGIA